ncbi:hypothetical protein PIB30_074998 [Stylosanthes scabra]|uniref:Uncharacterized protein n=1 Tax=Stylosanthes scabra TaxID=79078 RepID=A0ABU6UNP0_9FABA|nr:hypothetical protein [Stylosanthes scabra]
MEELRRTRNAMGVLLGLSRNTHRRHKAASLGRWGKRRMELPPNAFVGCTPFSIGPKPWATQIGCFSTVSSPRSSEEAEDVTEHFSMIQMENRVAKLELRVAVVEKKKIINWWLIVVGLAIGLVAIYVTKA